ncbi:hypothetical protein [Fervidibacillus halotolerans]|uniref:Uncharacterized protein n=1 Tax=Fervidibacillus halotolerans TaxID=2980027 RepID=A0A9E8M1F3_9BACI|nr:hypothetical protein [Fervidibacillus halotolerans]WAA13632.1 hypothetical protein OE105_05895 [Fervidibacillus halotolerans]
MNRAKIIKESQRFLFEISFVFFLWMILSRLIVINFVDRFIGITIVLLLFFQIIRLWKGRIRTEEAVKFANQFVGEDRVLSAYRFIEKNGPVEKLLVQDAVKHLEDAREQLMKFKAKKIYPIFLLLSSVFLFFGILSSLYPNEVMKEAKKQEKEREIVQELKERIRDHWRKETDPDLKPLQEELLQMIEDTKDANELLANMEKSLKENDLSAMKEQENAKNYEKWLEELRNSGLSSFADTVESKDMEAIKRELAQLEKQFNQLDEKSKNALKSAISEKSDESWTESLEKQIEEWKQLEKRTESVQKKGEYLANLRNHFTQQLASSNLLPPDVASDLKNETDRSDELNNGSGRDGGNDKGGNDTGQSQEINNGEKADRNGTSERNLGTNNGQRSGGGESGGSNSENRSGDRGAGIDSTENLFLTVPEKIDGPINLENDFGIIGEGSQGVEFESEGLAMKGNLRPYEEVFSEYEKAYFESTNRTRLPEELQKIIQNYFSSIKP